MFFVQCRLSDERQKHLAVWDAVARKTHLPRAALPRKLNAKQQTDLNKCQNNKCEMMGHDGTTSLLSGYSISGALLNYNSGSASGSTCNGYTICAS